MIPLEGLGVLKKLGLEQQMLSNDRHTAAVASRWGLCGVYGTRVSRSRIPSQTRGSIVLNKPKKEKYEHHAVYPGIAQGMRVPNDDAKVFTMYIGLVKRQNVLMLVLLHSCISGRRPPASQAAEAK